MRVSWVFGLLAAAVACTDRSFTPTVPDALNVGTNRTVFAASTRQKEENGTFGYDRSDQLSLLELTVSIPPTHTPGSLAFGYANPNPEKEFAIADRKEFADDAGFQAKVSKAIRARPRGERDITIFVHGYNATQAETAYRAAQLSHDLEIPGAMMIYSWPSRGKPLGYVYDNDSMLFARDGLEQLLRDISDVGAERLFIVAHSMGSALTMEALRQIELQEPGWSSRKLGGVVLISPDIDVEVFRLQFERLADPPEPFVVFVSKADVALNLSGRLRGGQQRLGNISNIREIEDLPIEIVDTTAFDDDAQSSHLVAGTSPTLLAMLKGARVMNDTFDSETPTLENALSGNLIQRSGSNRITLLSGATSGR